MDRIDSFPTHDFEGFKLRTGKPYPFGATLVPGGINFSVFSRHATYCQLVLFRKGEVEPFAEIPFRGLFKHPETGEPLWGEFRIGDVYNMVVYDLDYESIEYGFRLIGPGPKTDKGKPGLHRFDFDQILLDPYAKGIGGRDVWGAQPDWNRAY